MATQIVPGDGGPLQDQTITITVQQAYYYHAAWIKNGLVETLQTVADSVFQPSNVRGYLTTFLPFHAQTYQQ